MNGWPYRDAEGKLSFYAVRFECEGKDKIFLPFTFCVSPSNQLGEWRSQALPAPRPLYNLDKLAERPDAPVIVTEGEKKSDAAAALFPDFVSTNSSSGAQAASKTDWSAVRGRHVTIWRDNDKPGKKYEADVVKLARAAGARSVRVVDVPSSFDDGWDLADDPPEGVTHDDLRRMLAEAREPEAEPEAEAEPAADLPIFVASSLAGIEPPERDWLVLGLIPGNTVTLLSGDGGTGKSPLAKQLAVANAIGASWVGYSLNQGPCLFLTAEDDLFFVNDRKSST